MTASHLADPAMMGSAEAGLAHPRIEAEVAHQLLRRGEAADVANGSNDPGRHRQVDSSDRQQPGYGSIVERVSGDFSVDDRKIFGQAIEFADVSLDRTTFILGHWLA